MPLIAVNSILVLIHSALFLAFKARAASLKMKGRFRRRPAAPRLMMLLTAAESYFFVSGSRLSAA
jgi:hypothetical protein